MMPFPLTLIMFLPVVVFAGVAAMFSFSDIWVSSVSVLKSKLVGMK